MIRTVVVCDGCGHVEYAGAYPKTWPSFAPTEGAEAQRFCSRACVIGNLGTENPQPRHTGVGITDKEVRLLRLVALGRSNIEIAKEVRMATSSVKNRLSLLFLKLHAHDRVQAVLVAHALGLLNLNTLSEEYVRTMKITKTPLANQQHYLRAGRLLEAV